MAQPQQLLPVLNIDKFNGVLIDETKLPAESESFGDALKASLTTWLAKGYRGVWLKIQPSKSQFIPILVENGFNFHHAKREYVMLTKWLPQTEDRIPQAPSAYLGAGGFVINEKDEILVISERYNSGKAQVRWKIPGGLVDPGEDISEASVREVFEETGVKTEFVSMLAFRHTRSFIFGTHDVYFVCLLKPLNQDIHMQEDEISHCRWLPFEEYLSNAHVETLHKEIAQAAYRSLKDPRGAFSSNISSHLIPTPRHDEPYYFPTELQFAEDRLYHGSAPVQSSAPPK